MPEGLSIGSYLPLVDYTGYADRPAFYLLFGGTTSNELGESGTGRRLMRKEVDDGDN